MTEQPHRNLYVVDGNTYDLEKWIPKHPGGTIWFKRANGRDISAAVYAHHKDSKKVREVL